MKKFILFAAMALFTVAAQAQIVSSRSTGISKVEAAPKAGWSTLGFEYLPSSFSPEKGSTESFTGLAITWTKASSLTSSIPLFLELGLGGQYSFNSESEGSTDITKSMVSVKIPVNFIYDYQIPETQIHLDPYLGLRFRFNAWGQIKYEYKGDSKTYHVFDTDDMGDSDNTWNRFQVGWQIGLKARFNDMFFIGVAYGSDFSEIAKKVHINETQLSLGFVF